MPSPEIIILGGPNSGKTHLAGQLYGRIQHGTGKLRRAKEQGTPANLNILQEVLCSLAEGKAAGHTPVTTWGDVTLPMMNAADKIIHLKWPDYGGEQLNQIFQNRSVPVAWQNRLALATGWALIIRLAHETATDARPNQPRTSPPHLAGTDPVPTMDWDPNAKWVEILQILLHVSEHPTSQPMQLPRLTVLLSCYDELPASKMTPERLLAHHLPMFHAFLRATWAPDAWSVWGLSALGRPLTADHADDAFSEVAPELHGWVVAPGSDVRDPDLTAPIAWLLDGL